MGRRHRPLAAAVVVAALAAVTAGCQAPPPPLRVCADPNNLPFSNEAGEGFENKLAELMAAELGTTVRYTWWAQRRGFVRNTLRMMECDVIAGVPSSFELTLQTRPYYRSSYMFVSRRDRQLAVRSFDDEVLRTLRVGVHVIGDDYANAPPAHALSRRGIVNNVVGYSVFGDYSRSNPPARLVDAVGRGEIDLAVVWGPLAGYFSRLQPVPLDLTPVSPEIDLPFLPFVFDIAMGVRHGETALRDQLDAIIQRRGADIDALLESYGLPFVRRVRRASVAGGEP